MREAGWVCGLHGITLGVHVSGLILQARDLKDIPAAAADLREILVSIGLDVREITDPKISEKIAYLIVGSKH